MSGAAEIKLPKPRVSYHEVFGHARWMEAFERFRCMKQGTKIGTLYGVEIIFDYVQDEPHVPCLWVTWRKDGKLHHGGIHKGNAALLEIKA